MTRMHLPLLTSFESRLAVTLLALTTLEAFPWWNGPTRPTAAIASGVQTAADSGAVRQSLDSLAQVQLAALSAIRPGAFEQDVHDRLALEFRSRRLVGGYSLWIVGDRQQMNAGDLLNLLVNDFGPGRGQIARTYPVSGRFSREQRDIYVLVSDALQTGAQAARVGVPRVDIEGRIRRVVREGLLTLGLVADSRNDEYEKWYSDVLFLLDDPRPLDPELARLSSIRDPTPDERQERARLLELRRHWTLEPGMAFSMRLRIAIRQDELTRLPDSRLTKDVQRYANIDVELGDSFLLTPAGAERLSSGAPWRIEDVEEAIRRSRR